MSTPPETAETPELAHARKLLELGDNERMPPELAPCDARTIARWARLAFGDDDPRRHGVPPAFRNGVLHGFLLALDDSLRSLSEQQDDLGVKEVVHAMHVIKSIFPEAEEVAAAVEGH